MMQAAIPASTITILDFSYNPLMTGTLPKLGPTSVLQVLRLDGCPLLRDTNYNTAQLPPYIAPSTRYTKPSLESRYSCPEWTGANYPLQFSIDPEYYGYTGCQCDQGTYGNAPNCQLIPIAGPVGANPRTAAGQITDEVYGSSRMSIGIDTAWFIGSYDTIYQNYTSEQNVTDSQLVTNQEYVTSTVNVTSRVNVTGINGTWSMINTTTPTQVTSLQNVTKPINVTSLQNVTVPIRVSSIIDRTVAIYITIILTPLFDEFADIIDIYSGANVTSTPIVSLRGNYQRPLVSNYPKEVISAGYSTHHPSTVTFLVFAQHATLNFRSRDRSGQHFTANYTLSDSCPEGWYYDMEVTLRCQLIPAILPKFEMSQSIMIVVWVVAAIVFTMITCCFILVAYYSKTVIIKASSVPFCLSIVFCAALMTAGSIFYTLSPERGDYVCDARIWFSTLSLVALLACLLTKANRIRDIFTNDDLNKPVQTNKHLIQTVCMIIACEIILLIALTASNMSHPQLTIGNKATDGYQVYSCTSTESDSFKVWLAIQLTFIAVFLFGGTYIAFGIRNVPSAFNESSSIVNALYILTILSIILLPVNFIVDDNPNALALIRGVGQCLIALSMTLALFGPKFYYICDGRANDTSMVQTPLASSQASKKSGNRKRQGSDVEIRKGGAANTTVGSSSTNGQPTTSVPDHLLRRYKKHDQFITQIQALLRQGGSMDDIIRIISSGDGTGRSVSIDLSMVKTSMTKDQPARASIVGSLNETTHETVAALLPVDENALQVNVHFDRSSVSDIQTPVNGQKEYI